MIFKFGGQLQPVEIEEWEAERSPAVFVTDARHAEETLARAGIIYENEIRLEKIGFCKIENQQECVAGVRCGNALHSEVAGCTEQSIQDVLFCEPLSYCDRG